MIEPETWTVYDGITITKRIEELFGEPWDLYHHMEPQGNGVIDWVVDVEKDPAADDKVRDWLNREDRSTYCADRDFGLTVDDVFSYLMNRDELPEEDIRVHVWW